ncbi:M15 family metallopeptidase [Paenibacillus crassostreae]|uniref:Peptidase M15 n=1 Tax=Paenibacillus crassostreae TaxID=1763538 RepID=A0A162KQT0_9BACL|nr:M15 family metallopeptidase [Paenibacillus crassostreae]AOZ92445.1 peptidase M15 [Paenibacillus crassostreae]OAB72393.1 peptidase M15 [Paenibacillus crassostreae]
MNSQTWRPKDWKRLLIVPTLILCCVLLASCGPKTGGSAQEEGQALQAAPAGQGDQKEIVENEQGAANSGGQAVDPVMAVRSESSIQATIQEVEGQSVVTNPEAITVIVNKQRGLPEGYEPKDLVEPNVPFSFDGPHEKRMMRKEAAEALEELFAGAEADGIELRAVSGYRSYDRQKVIYETNVRNRGEEAASRVSSTPGNSEHQTGLAMDVSSPSVGNVLEESFGQTVEGKWLAEHASEYGFVIRYLEGAEDRTGYVYEPWHIRYIGTDIAPDLADSVLTVEEYFDETNIKL